MTSHTDAASMETLELVVRDLAGLSEMRARIASLLRDHRVDAETASDVQVAASELVTNGFVHAGAHRVEVRAHVGRRHIEMRIAHTDTTDTAGTTETAETAGTTETADTTETAGTTETTETRPMWGSAPVAGVDPAAVDVVGGRGLRIVDAIAEVRSVERVGDHRTTDIAIARPPGSEATIAVIDSAARPSRHD